MIFDFLSDLLGDLLSSVFWTNRRFDRTPVSGTAGPVIGQRSKRAWRGLSTFATIWLWGGLALAVLLLTALLLQH